MTERICSIMSRPEQQDNVSDDEDRRLAKERGFYIVGNQAWDNVFPCLHEKCTQFATCWVKEIEQMYRYGLKEEPEKMEAELRRLIQDREAER
jgi:hypothetical protein